MKPVASTITETDTLPGEEVKFSISEANSAWVMRSMADLYSNRELACIREYSTNAYDSNKQYAMENNLPAVAPIKVTLPSTMNPYFEVSDEGVGMSEHELKEVYTKFGESTKRDSDDFNGMLGFGSKSAIAYTNTFTVDSVKNGVKTVAVVTRREDSQGGYLVTLKVIISNVPTTEHSGVTIRIPVHNWSEFAHKAKDFYRFWMPGTVLVNGSQPEWAVGEKIDEGLYYSAAIGTSYVVMGNVPYRIANPDALFPSGMNRISFVAYVPLGTVEFTPSREDLKYSEHTKRNLHKIIGDFVASAVEKAKSEIANSATHAEAYKNWVKWYKVIGKGQVDDLTFKGDKLVEWFPINATLYDTTAYRYATRKVDKYSVGKASEALIVTNFDVELAASHKRKVKDWLKFKNHDAYYILFTKESTVSSPWVDPGNVVTWDTVKAEAPKPARKPGVPNVNAGRLAGSFDLVSASGKSLEKDVPSTTPLYFVRIAEYNVRRDEFRTVLQEFGIKEDVVLVPANREAKFLRHYPHAKDIIAELRSQVELDGSKLLSPEAHIYLNTNINDRNRMAKMEAKQIKDPEMKSLIAIYVIDEAIHLKDYRRQHRLASVLGMRGKFLEHPYQTYDARKFEPLKRYPLARTFVRSPMDDADRLQNIHVYEYMNAIYSARKDGKNV